MRLPHSYYSQLLLFHFVIQTRGTHVVGTGFSQTEVCPNLYNDNRRKCYILFGEKCVSETSARAYTQGNLKPSLISWHGLSIKQNSATCRYDKLVIYKWHSFNSFKHAWIGSLYLVPSVLMCYFEGVVQVKCY